MPISSRSISVRFYEERGFHFIPCRFFAGDQQKQTQLTAKQAHELARVEPPNGSVKKPLESRRCLVRKQIPWAKHLLHRNLFEMAHHFRDFGFSESFRARTLQAFEDRLADRFSL